MASAEPSHTGAHRGSYASNRACHQRDAGTKAAPRTCVASLRSPHALVLHGDTLPALPARRSCRSRRSGSSDSLMFHHTWRAKKRAAFSQPPRWGVACLVSRWADVAGTRLRVGQAKADAPELRLSMYIASVMCHFNAVDVSPVRSSRTPTCCNWIGRRRQRRTRPAWARSSKRVVLRVSVSRASLTRTIA